MKEIKEMFLKVTQISQITQIYFQRDAALGIPKGDACYRRDARNERNKRNVFKGHTDLTDNTDLFSKGRKK